MVSQKRVIEWAREMVLTYPEKDVQDLIDGLSDLNNEALPLHEQQALVIAHRERYGD